MQNAMSLDVMVCGIMRLQAPEPANPAARPWKHNAKETQVVLRLCWACARWLVSDVGEAEPAPCVCLVQSSRRVQGATGT